MPAAAVAFFRQVNELNDATGFYLLRLSELVAQRKGRRQKYHERQNSLTGSICRCCDGLLCQRGWCCAHLVSAAVASRPSPRDLLSCFPSIWRRIQRAAQLLAGRSFDTAAKGAKSVHLVARDAGSLKWPITRSRRPWSLDVAPCGAHPCFRDCTPSREQRHVSARRIMDDLRLATWP
jgi:hypothetical protein